MSSIRQYASYAKPASSMHPHNTRNPNSLPDTEVSLT